MKISCEKNIMNKWKNNNPLVSICCTAYNQELYIEEALKSFLIQETSFAYEIIVSDDCSTDNTTKILQEYVKKYPNIIKLIHFEENQYSKGALPIRDFILPKVKGKYIALCEGDDYWTNPNKLQIQVDFLEKHENFIGCGHNTQFFKNGKLTNQLFIDSDNHKDSYIFDDFIDSAYMHTTSLVLKYNCEYRHEIDKYLSKYSNVDRNDVYMLLVFSKFGPIKYINDVMSVYRINDGGIWSGAADEDQLIMFLKGCIDFSHLFGDEHKEKFLYSFANTLSEESTSRTDNFRSKALNAVSEKDLKTILKYFTIFKKRDNETIKECSQHINHLEKLYYDNSLKSLVIKFAKFIRLDYILKKIKSKI